MGHFIEVEQRYLNGEMNDPESESFLEPEKITPSKYVTTKDSVWHNNITITTSNKGNKGTMAKMFLCSSLISQALIATLTA